MASLFKNTALQEKLSISIVPHFEEKIEVVKQWNRALQDKSLLGKTETQCEQAFNADFFVKILGYTRFPSNQYTIEVKAKVESAGGQKPDATLGTFNPENNSVQCVCEIKDAKTSLDKPQQREGNLTPVQQGFKYKPLYRNCGFVIVTNFREIRLYRDTMHDYERFTLEELADPTDDYRHFRKFHYLLCADHFIAEGGKSRTEELLAAIRIEQEEITKKFYKEYRDLRLRLIENIRKNNPDVQFDIVLEKAQKIVDRIVFASFCEDIGLLPENKLAEVVHHTEKAGLALPIWEIMKLFFRAVDGGSAKMEMPHGYNGELFKVDAVLDALQIDDNVCREFIRIGRFNFHDDLTVNILGHIFEQSITDIEELKSLNATDVAEKPHSKRKKEGIYYTPEYIVDFIVSSTLGKHLEELEAKMLQKNSVKEDVTDKNYEKRATAAYQEYLEAISKVTVLDLACGSGAFLVKVFDYLKKEHERVAQILEELTGRRSMDVDDGMIKTLLHGNIFGVDLNEESIEITKLSLWLKTAQKGKKLEELKGNIKCGNSLIDDISVSDKAFEWEKEFANILKNEGFDLVIGNPPYVGEKGNKETFYPIKEAEWGQKFYHGKMDLFYFFFHRGLDLLKDGGRLGFITTNYFVTAYGGRKLRKDIKERAVVEHIANFNEMKIFDDAKGQHNMITVLRKGQNPLEKAAIINFYDKSVPLPEVLNIGSADRKGAEVAHIQQRDLYDGEENYIRIQGNPSDGPVDDLLDKVKSKSDLLGNICNVNTGLFTAADNIFVFDASEIESAIGLLNSLERSLFKQFYKNSDIARYTTNVSTQKRVLYHHEKASYALSHIPNIYKYLQKHKKILESRKDNSLKGALKRGRWDVMSLSKIAINFEGPKIVAPQRSPRNTFGYNEIEWYASADVYFITQKTTDIHLKYVLGILNSRLIYLWLFHRGKRKGDTLELYQKPLSEVPIKVIEKEAQKPFIEIIDVTIDLHTELNAQVGKFSMLISSEYGLDKWPAKLERFWELSFDDFIKALKLKNVPLQRKQELMEYFEEQKAKFSKLAAKIDSLQREIDEMVYEVYGLTKEEKEIVLQSVS